MKTNEYFAADADQEPERERLGLFEALLDPLTLHRCATIGVGPGWCCLLVGAGRGALAPRLADVVGPTGQVVATDRDARFLRDRELPGVEIREHDILSDPLETAHFDLVHCRCLLMHLKEPNRALQKMTAALRPGGWLLVEEPDDTAAGPVNSDHPFAERFAQANRRLLEQLKADGVMNPYIGRQLGDLLKAVGLRRVHCEGVTWVHRGGDVAARLALETLALHENEGRYSQADGEATRRVLSDPNFTFVDTTWFGARGQRTGPE
jgi:SAM-dependent methyltransferase